MLGLGAHVEDISVLFGPAVSGRNYEVPAEMAAEVEAALPGSRTTTSRGTPGLDLRAGIARQLTALGVTAIDVDPRCTVEDRTLFSHRRDRTDRTSGVVGVDGMTEPWRPPANSNWPRRCRPSGLGSRTPQRPPDAMSTKLNYCPITKFFPATDVVILTRLGCAAFGESREQEASNKADEVSAMLGAEPIRWHMVGRIQRNKARSIAGWAYAAHSVDSAKVIAALDRAAARALDEGRRAEPLRVYIQISLDGDE